MDMRAIERLLDYRFTTPALLATALTHSSFVNENPEAGEHNERLEFLGDAVLELVVSHEIYRRFPGVREGELTRARTRLVNESALARVACELDLQSHIRMGKGEETQGGRERKPLLADTLEALIGAVYLDGGFDSALRVVMRIIGDRIPAELPSSQRKDFKTLLQEVSQAAYRQRPIYTQLGVDGPEHQTVYEVEVALPDGQRFSARAANVKKAQQKAAQRALIEMGVLEDAGWK